MRLFILLFSILFVMPAFSATPTIITGATPLDRNLNLATNGGFESPSLSGGASFSGGPQLGVDGDGYHYISPGTTRTPFASIEGWSVSGGGSETYASWGNDSEAAVIGPFNIPLTGIAYSDPNNEGERSVYLGNSFVASLSEIPSFSDNGEVTFPSPPIIIPADNYGTGLTLEQTLSGLVVGQVYRMSFFVSGEASTYRFGSLIPQADGIMGIKIDGYDMLYLTIPSGSVAPEDPSLPHVFGDDDSHTYTLEIIAGSESMNIAFISWGHFRSTDPNWPGSTSTEAVLDDVIFNLVPSAAKIPIMSIWGLSILAGLLGLMGFFRSRKP